MISYEQCGEFLQFANRVLDVAFDPKDSVWISHLDEAGEVLAVVVFNRFSKTNCELSVATNGDRRWFSRAFARACYAYPFVQMGMNRITSVVEDGNIKALKMNRQLGHVQEGVLKEWFGEKDGIVFRMLKTECKWV